ncbi:MAG: VOC family protein [Gammaproteobacteria bacterium]|nr:VOC family protein [Gammaproteobacteria bacterium]
MSVVSPDDTRVQFSKAMSTMYGDEVPAYNTLLEMVAGINKQTLDHQPELRQQLDCSDNLTRITEERHGAIRLGKPEELHTMRRLFAVMGMYPVSYYDLSVAGIPVHATAFRPITRDRLSINPFRVFTSLLRLDLLDDEQLRIDSEEILAKRDIFTPGARELINVFEQNGGLTAEESTQFVKEALETFRWHSEATVTGDMYDRLHDAHRLVADVVSFKGPHINHLTPRTLDIDCVQTDMPKHGINPKATIEGPPPRKCPILLRQTSFKALEEPVKFLDDKNDYIDGNHTARFGEIEQRGVALTRKGRQLYDTLLHEAREQAQNNTAISYEQALEQVFSDFPDDWETLRKEQLAFFEYHSNTHDNVGVESDLDSLIEAGKVTFTPVIYEDFLPVSAAGIFQSNLGGEEGQNFAANANQSAFEEALGATVSDEFELYKNIEKESLVRLFDK